ncbi:MAG: S-layer homology domain-containing protein [bacterium JZ-2024 1]
MKKILLGGFLILLFHSQVRAVPFPDVPLDHWAYDAVEYLAAKGIVEGYPDGEFKGDRLLTRYEYAVIIARLERRLAEDLKKELGVPAEVLSLVEQLKDTFSRELEEIKAKLGEHEERLAALETGVKGLEARTTVLEGKVEEHQKLLDYLMRLKWDGYVRFGTIRATGDSFSPAHPRYSQSDADFAFSLGLEVPVNEQFAVHTRLSTLTEQGTHLFGDFDPNTIYSGLTYGKYDTFHTGDYRVPVSNVSRPGSQEVAPLNKSFDLNEAYLEWKIPSSRVVTKFYGGKFHPWWFNTPLWFNPYWGYEGLGAGFTFWNKLDFSLASLRTERFFTFGTPPAPPVSSLDDLELLLLILSSRGKIPRNVEWALGFVTSNETDRNLVISDSPSTTLAYGGFRFKWKGQPYTLYAGFAGNNENLKKVPAADYADDDFVQSLLVGFKGREITETKDWAFDFSWKKIGLNTGLPSYYVPDTNFFTAKIYYQYSKNIFWSLIVDRGVIGDNAAGPKAEKDITSVSAGISAKF